MNKKTILIVGKFIFSIALLVTTICLCLTAFSNYQTAKTIHDSLVDGQEKDIGAWVMQQSLNAAFENWDDFDCTFDNKTMVLTTECGGDGDMVVNVFSDPQINISLGHWDTYRINQTTWKDHVPSYTRIQLSLIIQNNCSSNVTIVVTKNIDNFHYNANTITKFEPKIYTFMVRI